MLLIFSKVFITKKTSFKYFEYTFLRNSIKFIKLVCLNDEMVKYLIIWISLLHNYVFVYQRGLKLTCLILFEGCIVLF